MISVIISGLSILYYPPNRTNSTLFFDKAIFQENNYGLILMILITYSIQLSLFILFVAQFFNKRKIIFYILIKISFPDCLFFKRF